ncbi:MAG: hypothetical protein HZB51_26110 [Chloroflexi bacterium]|nr:hypothetical protein [Chloroflexota bacterium]
MNNALFITGLATFFHIWGGATLGTAIAKLSADQFDRQVLSSIIGGTLLAFVPLLITGPTWVTLNQPIILAVEMLILVVAIGFPMFVPSVYREKFFGTRTYWIWLGIGLVFASVYLFFQPKEMSECIGLSTFLAGLFFLWRGVGLLRKP